MDPTSDPNNPNLLPSQIFTTVAALLPAIDRRIIVVLRDGRKFFGVLRSFDQFANLVIQDTLERIYINQSTFGEAYRGVFIVRGENVVYVGELDEAREEQEDSLVVDSPTANANIEPFPRFSPGTLLAERQQVRLKQQQQIERNAETGKPVIRRIPFEDAQKIHASVAQSTLEAHIKQTSTLPNEKFTDTLELAYY